MIRYTVVWHDDVLNGLMRIWMNAADRDEIASATAAIDRELAEDADQKGRPVGDRLRVLRKPPLEILFDVSEPDRLVRIVALERRGKNDLTGS